MEDKTKWGVPTSQKRIRNDFTKILSSPITNISFSHIKKGFTDNVFLVTVILQSGLSHKFIVKEYLKEWHQKEKRIYEQLLPKYELGTPKLIQSGSNYIILEHIPSSYIEIQKQQLGLLREWIIKKHKIVQGSSILDNFQESKEIQQHYLIEKPLNLIEQVAKMRQDKRLIITRELADKVLSQKDKMVKYIELQDKLPQTIEHGDLEPQNLLCKNNKMVVVDWVNARKGCGLFDINQYFETAHELGADVNVDEEMAIFERRLGIADLKKTLDQIRALMLLNKIHFYLDKYISKVEKSESKNTDIVDILENYLVELQQLLLKE